METLSVRCNHCGAPLGVGAQTRFVTCQFCHSSLEVKRTESSVFTEEVARMADNTEKMAGSLEAIELQNEIERLDREWASGHPPGAGSNSLPTGPRGAGGAILGLGFTIFFALACFGMAAAAGSAGGGLFALVPIGMGLFALTAGIMATVKSQSMTTALRQNEADRANLVRQYQQKRDELTSRLQAKRENRA